MNSFLINVAKISLWKNYGSILFNCTKKGHSEEPVGSIASACVLWESFGTITAPNTGDIVSDLSYDSEKGLIGFSANADGNAVIAVKDATGTILWSWHIWVCKDFDPDAMAHVYNNNAGTVMDRNLGATSATPGDVKALGLLYQWGRKDPFLSGNTFSYKPSYLYDQDQAASTLDWPSSEKATESTGTIQYAISHPTTFITINWDNNDWLYTGSTATDDTRWQTYDKEKGIFDPCPAGWRVPDGGKSGLWSKAFGSSDSFEEGPWDNTNKGYNFGSQNGKSIAMQLGNANVIWYPAAGCRNCADGELDGVSFDGRYWTSTPSDKNAYFHYFDNSANVLPAWNQYRACGYSIRCQREISLTSPKN